MKTEDFWTQFAEDIDFDALKDWCEMFGIDYDEPPIDDMWPDWDGEIRTELAEALMKIGG